MLILDLWDISFHAVVVFGRGMEVLTTQDLHGLGKDISFKSVLVRCALVHSVRAKRGFDG